MMGDSAQGGALPAKLRSPAVPCVTGGRGRGR